ncbi:chemotaxis protein [Gilvimarinus agarilyticus]|uniref:chemotaxis protein n=1 Tax=Gilvimarinus sp. 2_MG-2023 TaxID=3062666 RepID=UPI001C094D30|nr:chemotaxis protein [Gilvimarinus sp. 2_MG-2023]MBU2885122.1 chemotaxis protein [Gilvimarinus agarilyticus]MDO6570020.1 chemotaxis protein [Gilvimarinus sp. 2_MG-2023]
MSSLLDSVDQRTNLVGENRLELLIFELSGRQRFAINVFKVQEVLKMPSLRQVPHSHPHVCGVAHLRGKTVPIIDLGLAIGMGPTQGLADGNLIVAEYNRSIQAFAIGRVDRIVNLNWEDILPPPKGTGRAHYLTAITRQEGTIVEILDVERVLADIIPYNSRVSEDVLNTDIAARARQLNLKALVAEDSSTAVTQIRETLSDLGIGVVAMQDGLKALNNLKSLSASGKRAVDEYLLLITDAEMPEMDGYRLTAEIRQDSALSDLHVVMHTSLSGSFNQVLVEKVGCDAFLSKFAPDELATVVQKRLQAYLNDLPA